MTGSGAKKSKLQDRLNAAGGWGANPREIFDEEEPVTNYIGPGHDGKDGHVKGETVKKDDGESSDLSSLPCDFDDDNDAKPGSEPRGGDSSDSSGNGGRGSTGGGSGGRGNKRKGDGPDDDQDDPSTYAPSDPKGKNPAKATRLKKKTKTRSITKTNKAKSTVSSAAGTNVSQALIVLTDTHELNDDDKGELYRLYRQAALRDGLTWEEVRQEIATSKNWLPSVDYVPPPQKPKEVVAQPGMLTRAMNTITNLMGGGSSSLAQGAPPKDGAAPAPDRMSNGVPIVPLPDNMFSQFMDMMDPRMYERAAAAAVAEKAKNEKEGADVEEAKKAEAEMARTEKRDAAIEGRG